MASDLFPSAGVHLHDRSWARPEQIQIWIEFVELHTEVADPITEIPINWSMHFKNVEPYKIKNRCS